MNTNIPAQAVYLAIFFLLLFSLPDRSLALEVVDISGRQVWAPDQVVRLVALRGALSLAVYLELSDRVVGVESQETADSRWVGSRGRTYRMAHPELGGLPVVASRQQLQPEKILAVAPDLIVLGSGNRHEAETLERQTRIPVVLVGSGDLGGERELFYQSLRLFGRLTGTEDRARAVIDRIDRETAALAGRVAAIAPTARKKVYIGGLQFKVAHGILGTSRDYPPFQMAGALNVVDALPVDRQLVRGRFSLKLETFVGLEPEVVFICGGGLDLVNEDLRKPVYRQAHPLQGQPLHLLLPHYYGADPATVLSEAWYVGKVLYPELFHDIDIAAKADQLYGFFVGRPLYQEMADLFGGFTVFRPADRQE
ncbi:MAG TPA: iron ABC transporter substrate-binding protein [Proteobacteria bacterium]|nr:iron ABC transporter substrate-binding protein [Pseudomonadota bacterium]